MNDIGEVKGLVKALDQLRLSPQCLDLPPLRALVEGVEQEGAEVQAARALLRSQHELREAINYVGVNVATAYTGIVNNFGTTEIERPTEFPEKFRKVILNLNDGTTDDIILEANPGMVFSGGDIVRRCNSDLLSLVRGIHGSMLIASRVDVDVDGAIINVANEILAEPIDLRIGYEIVFSWGAYDSSKLEIQK
jgi:hypothetical protein